MGTVVEPYLFVGFHFFLSSKNALFQGNEVEMSTLHFHFCDFRGDIALQIPCDLEVAVDRFSDGKLSVVEDCVDPSVGDNTEQGKVFEAAQIDDRVKTPLNEQLDGLSDWITKVSYGFSTLIIIERIIAFFVTNGTDYLGSWE